MAAPDRACPDYPNECLHPWAHARTYAEVKATQTKESAVSYLNPHTHQLDTPRRPRVVTLCGSTRFKEDFERVNRDLTLGGYVVLAPGVFGHADGIELSTTTKEALDALHLRKIDLADEVLVVNPGGYVGDSTRNEIAYAIRIGKPIGYTDGPTPS